MMHHHLELLRLLQRLALPLAHDGERRDDECRATAPARLGGACLDLDLVGLLQRLEGPALRRT
jgi:hypothetical protein